MIPELPEKPERLTDQALLFLRREYRTAVDAINAQLSSWKNLGGDDRERKRRTLDALRHAQRNLRVVKDLLSDRHGKSKQEELYQETVTLKAEVARLREAIATVQRELAYRGIFDHDGRDTLVRHWAQAVLDGKWQPKLDADDGRAGQVAS